MAIDITTRVADSDLNEQDKTVIIDGISEFSHTFIKEVMSTKNEEELDKLLVKLDDVE